MANPFSGLENIGQSYLAGLQLANQRQYREEAAAQRAEDTRVREQYYTQMGADREAALKDRIQARRDAAASQFGQDLVLNPQGEPDYGASALKRDRRLQSDTLASAEGELYAMYGTQPPLSPEIIGSPAYQAGRLRGTARTMADKRAENVALIRRGFMPMESERQLPSDVENQIEGFSPDIFDGGGAPLTEAPMGTGAPSGGGQLVTINGRQYRAPAARAGKAEKAGTMKFTDPNGVEYSLPVSPEAARDLLSKRLASPEGEQDPYADIDEALKNLRKLAKNKDDEVNVYEDAEGNVKVRKDQFGYFGESEGLTFGEAKAQLEVKRKDRKQMMRESETPPGPEAGIKQGTNRVPSISPNQVIDVRSIKGLRPIGRGTNAPVATTNAPPQVRLPVDSLAPASSMSSESLSELDLDELRQAMLEAQSNGMDPAVLGLQIRQALNEAGVPTAAGTNSIPFGLSNEKLDAILRLPRGRAPVEL
jgi:hypothetical protein